MDLSWGTVLKDLIFWGPGAVIAALILFGIYRLANRFGGDFIAAQQAQAIALAQQATSMAGLTGSLQSYITRDNAEHREMLVLLKYIAQKNQAFEDVEREHHKRVKDKVKCTKELDGATDSD